MNIDEFLFELRAERTRINRAIRALERSLARSHQPANQRSYGLTVVERSQSGSHLFMTAARAD